MFMGRILIGARDALNHKSQVKRQKAKVKSEQPAQQGGLQRSQSAIGNRKSQIVEAGYVLCVR
jgi:hypothetical protein